MTRYDIDRADFSGRVHMTARRVLYPAFFGVPAEMLEYVECDAAPMQSFERALDTRLGIDKIVRVCDPQFRLPIPHAIQERFQRPVNARRRNITITEFNESTGLPSEMYKMVAQWFVGAFASEDAQVLTEGVIVSVPDLRRAMRAGRIRWDCEKFNDKGQPFIRLTFDDLLDSGVAQLHIVNNEIVYDRFGDPLDDEIPMQEEGFGMPPILFVDDVAAFWRNYYIRTPEEWEAARR